MKTLGTIFKTALSIAATMYLGGSSSSFDLFGTITIFAAVYGLLTWYIYSFANGSPIFMGDGLMSFAFAMILNLCLPLVVIVAPMFVLETILPGEIGMIIGGIILLVACAGCVIGDFVHIVRLFKPDFLGGGVDLADG